MPSTRSNSISRVHEVVQWLEDVSEGKECELRKEQQLGPPMKQPDCCMASDSFYLAQASLAASLPEKTHLISVGDAQVRLGKGLDGLFSRETGFIGREDSQRPLPAPFRCWEEVHSKLPILLRKGIVKQKVDALPALSSEVAHLPQSCLARAALVLSALAHSYFFGHRDDDDIELPRHIEEPWKQVSSKLGRPFAGRVVADDILNNVKLDGEPFELSSSYFDVLEERLSSGLQGFMESEFAPALSIMTEAHNHLLAKNDEGLAVCLQRISSYIVRCADVFLNITPQSAKQGFDPIIWIKTYPAMGNPVREGELGNSGVDAPLFHALDAFLGREVREGDLRGMQKDRRGTLPENIQTFLKALENPDVDVRDYVEKSPSTRLNAAFDGVIQIYAWFLERHRVKAVGVTGVSLGSGKHTTSSGAKSGNKSAPIPPDAMLSQQMKAGIASRLGSRNASQTAAISSIMRGELADAIILEFDTALPLEAGDRIQVWPENEAEEIELVLSMMQHKLGESISHDQFLYSMLSRRDLRTAREIESASRIEVERFVENLPSIEPRYYSISDVKVNEDGLAISSSLTVGHGDGLATNYWMKVKVGDQLHIRAVPALRFRSPRDMAAPLVLIGQGSGIGPLLGFIRARLRAQNQSKIGKMLLIAAARASSQVIALGEIQNLTKMLPLIVKLALTEENNMTIESGKCIRSLDISSRVSRVIQENLGMISNMLAEEGHIFVCGSTAFGVTVRRALGKAPKGSACCLGRSFTPPPPSDWKHYHEDLFGHRSSPPSRAINVEELAQHNRLDDCWTAIDSVVYDLTKFLAIHPGGSKVLMESAGTIADRRFHETHGGPYFQEIRGQLGFYAIGQLVSSTVSKEKHKLLETIVRLQNTLTNNTAFPPDRNVSFYTYSDALVVFAEVGLEDWRSALKAANDASDVKADEAIAVLTGTQEVFRNAFQELRSRSWAKLAEASVETLSACEEEVRQDYMKQTVALHSFIDSFKLSLN